MASADVPVASNAGCYRPVKIIAPPGTCVNAASPAPVVHRIAIGHRLATVLFAALAQGDARSNARGLLRRVLRRDIPDHRSQARPQGAGRDRDRRLRRAALSRRRLRALLRHAQQLQHPHGDDRERHAADVPRLRPAGRIPAARAGSAAGSGCGASGASIARPRSSPPTSTASSSARSVSTAASRRRSARST